MKRNDFLLSNRVKNTGWAILGTGVLLWIAWLISNGELDFSINNIRQLLGLAPIDVDGTMADLARFTASSGLVPTITSVLILIGSYLAGFSRCKDEDEFTQYLRYRALTVTVVGLMAINLVVQLLCWGINYLVVRNILVKFSPIFYVVYFHLMVIRERRRNEE